MKKRTKLVLINLFFWITLPATANLPQYDTQQTADNTKNLVQYLKNLGSYLGYDITKTNNNTINQNLLNIAGTQLIQKYVVNTFLGALPINAFENTQLSQPLAGLTPWLNYTFQRYNTPSQQNVSIVNNIDQQIYQLDPVSQGILNILSTPSDTYCMNGNNWVGCHDLEKLYVKPESSILANIIGEIPSSYQYFTYQYNQKLLSQLNSDTLVAPLMYSTEDKTSDPTSSRSTSYSQNTATGLSAQTQAQEAANFIRYVSGSTTPIPLPELKAYNDTYTLATKSSGNPAIQIQAQNSLNNYFTTLRAYAAQYSVGVSNLYHIMSKRLPQGQNNTQSSQALNEFKMASWRLYNEDMSQNNQWTTQINNASSATVEKEIATLLAEINYQMYLSRQIQERILLTNSIMLLQNTRSAQPSFTGYTNPTPDSQ